MAVRGIGKNKSWIYVLILAKNRGLTDSGHETCFNFKEIHLKKTNCQTKNSQSPSK